MAGEQLWRQAVGAMLSEVAPGAHETAPSAGHVPVLRTEMLAALAVRPQGVYLDATFGAGGYARAILKAGAGMVVALDRDPEAVERGRALARLWPNFAIRAGRFSELQEHLAALAIARLDGVVLDLGVSSLQLADARRGFSFQADGPLDMRMSRAGESAADVVNRADERTLVEILWRYGEERAARRIARAIVNRRDKAPIERTSELADLVAHAARVRPGERIHPATRTFQALRIHVNDELGELERALAAAERVLAPGGRLVVVAFHSLEDRLVKHFLAERSERGHGTSRHRPPAGAPAASFRVLTRRPMRAGPDEIARNPRARSARLRAAERLAETEAA